MRPTATRAALLVGVGLASLLPGCGDSPTAPPPPPPPPPRVSFQPAMGPAPQDAISLQLVDFTTDEIRLVLRADEVVQLFGFGVDLVYDPTFLELLETEARDFLGGEGITVETQIVDNPVGRLIIGQTRVGDVAGVTGSGELLRFRFRTLTAGNRMLLLENGSAFAASGELLSTQFLGGNLTVRP